MITTLILFFTLHGSNFTTDCLIDHAIKRELLDERQVIWFKSEYKNLEETIAAIKILEDQVKGYPSINYHLMFPSTTALDTTRQQIDNLLNIMSLKLSILPYKKDYENVIEYLKNMRKVYNHIVAANSSAYYVNYRRQCLKLYRDMVGTELFNRGWLPDIPWESIGALRE